MLVLLKCQGLEVKSCMQVLACTDGKCRVRIKHNIYDPGVLTRIFYMTNYDQNISLRQVVVREHKHETVISEILVVRRYDHVIGSHCD